MTINIRGNINCAVIIASIKNNYLCRRKREAEENLQSFIIQTMIFQFCCLPFLYPKEYFLTEEPFFA